MVQKSRHTEKKIALKITARILVRFLYFEVEIAPRDYFFRAANFGVFLEKSRGAKKNRAEKGMSTNTRSIGNSAARTVPHLFFWWTELNTNNEHQRP